MSESLEQLLKSQYSKPVDSSGEFTMDAEKALQKLANYQLPYPDAWVIKLGQGAVLSGADELKIHQTSTETSFSFTPQLEPESDFAKSLFDPSSSSIEWWQHFRSALWSLGFSLKRPFTLKLLERVFFWDGFKLHEPEYSRPSTVPERLLILSISHRTAEQGKGLPILRRIHAARMNARLGKIFREVLFSCPMKVFLDGLDLDGFQRAPGRGFCTNHYPIEMYWVEGQPTLAIPPSTQANVVPKTGQRGLAELSGGFTSEPPDFSVKAAAFISAHARCGAEHQNGYKTTKKKSVFYWIRHGVVIQKDEFQIPALCVSMAVFATCDHISTDMTGFGLEEGAKAEARTEICKSIDKSFDISQMDFVLHNRETYESDKKTATAIFATGVALQFVSVFAFSLTGAGLMALFALSGGIFKVDKAVNRDLRILKTEWSKLYQ